MRMGFLSKVVAHVPSRKVKNWWFGKKLLRRASDKTLYDKKIIAKLGKVDPNEPCFNLPLNRYLRVLKGRDADRVRRICCNHYLNELEAHRLLITEFDRILKKKHSDIARKRLLIFKRDLSNHLNWLHTDRVMHGGEEPTRRKP
jgi:hypothetical protein